MFLLQVYQLTSTVGSVVTSFNESGWGQDSWGIETWGESGNVVALTGLSATASVGVPAAGADQGWGRTLWGDEPWGDSDNPVVSLPSFALTTSLNIPSEFISTKTRLGYFRLG